MVTRQTYLFFSFDVVNSTRLKNDRPDAWAGIIVGILDDLYELVHNPGNLGVTGARTWKHIGDEIVFFVPVTSLDALDKAVRNVYLILQTEYNRILNDDKVDAGISVKAAAWIASVSEDSRKGRNIYTELDDETGSIEILGPEIDAGFRMFATGGRNRQLVLSFELAYILLSNMSSDSEDENITQFHLVGFNKLKGVWKEALYPQIWYFIPGVPSHTKPGKQTSEKKSSIHETFSVDIAFGDAVCEKYAATIKEETKGAVINGRTKDVLEKIYKEQKKSKIIKALLDGMHTPDEIAKVILPRADSRVVAVCLSPEKDRIFVRKSTFPGEDGDVWNFGYVSQFGHKTITAEVTSGYHNAYGIDIVPFTLNAEMEHPFSPIYFRDSVNEETGSCTKEIYVLAITIGPISESNYLRLENIENLDDDACIPEFSKICRLALKVANLSGKKTE